MSAFNVGKKVSAAVRILQRKRDASARATHLVAKKDPLITFEKAFLGQATGGKFPSVTFIERKIMSTKTSIKRIALVAAAALTLGGFTAVSASATVVQTGTPFTNVLQAYSGAVTSSISATTASSSGSQVVGGTAIVQFYDTAAATAGDVMLNATSSGAGAISTAAIAGGSNTAITTLGTPTAPALGTSFAAGLSLAAGNGAGGGSDHTGLSTINVFVTSAVAGTQTLTFTTLNTSGTPSGTYTATITWIAATATGVNAANSSLYLVNTNTCITPSATGNKASDTAAIGNATNTTSSVLKSAAVYACWIARDASNNLISSTANVFTSFGVTPAATTGTSNVTTTLASAITGANNVTALLTDGYGNTVTLTTAVTVYGSMATIALANGSYAAAKGGAHDSGTAPVTGALAINGDGIGVATSAQGLILVSAKDSAGALINANAGGNLTSAAITVTSDANPGVTVATGGSNSAGATVVFGTDANSSTSGTGKGGTLVVDCHSSTKAEKLSIVLSALNSAGTRVSSNAVTFYCSTSAKAVTVTPASASVDAGATTTLTASVTDAQGYPAADGTSVTFASTGQGVVAPATSATSNGVAGTTDTNLVNFIAAGDGGSATVTAIAGNYSGSTSISVAGGSGSSSLSLDAANAATDAANNAYDEAQNATQAASDALAAVTALSAQVGALIATVKSLAAVVAKIKAKVKA
jgi:hypothetical protein